MNLKTTYIQFAKDYNFIDSWKITDEVPNSEEIEKFINSGQYENICFECFLDTPEGYLVIGYSCTNNDFCRFISDSINFSKSDQQINKYISEVGDIVPNMTRVGILDYWFETGPCLLRSNDDKNITKEEVLAKIGEYPEIIKTKLNPQGLSFYFSKEATGYEHWIMYNVGLEIGDYYELDVKRVLELMN